MHKLTGKGISVLALGLLLHGHSAMAGEVRVAVAANFLQPLEYLKTLFEQRGEHSLTLSSGSTGQLYAQIKNGAPYDVFLAADMRRPELLVEEGAALEETLRPYAVGKLVLWSAREDLINDEAEALKQGKFTHLAIANPKTAPYGAAAREVLQNMGLWEDFETRIVQGQSITQTYQFIATGNAEMGFIAYSQLKSANNPGGSMWKVPPELYSPIKQGIVQLRQVADPEACRDFLAFMQSEAILAVIEEKFGYARP